MHDGGRSPGDCYLSWVTEVDTVTRGVSYLEVGAFCQPAAVVDVATETSACSLAGGFRCFWSAVKIHTAGSGAQEQVVCRYHAGKLAVPSWSPVALGMA